MNTSSLPPHPAAELAERLEGILATIAWFIFGRLDILGDLGARLHNRVGRARRRLANLLATLAAGLLPRGYASRPGRKGGASAIRFPRSRAWLVAKLGYQAAGYASQLEHLLRDPQTQATLAAAPPSALKSAARILRPLCHLLGVSLPPLLQAPPRPARPPKPALPAAEKPAPLAPLRPLHPRRFAREMPPLFPFSKIRPA